MQQVYDSINRAAVDIPLYVASAALWGASTYMALQTPSESQRATTVVACAALANLAALLPPITQFLDEECNERWTYRARAVSCAAVAGLNLGLIAAEPAIARDAAFIGAAVTVWLKSLQAFA